MHRGARELPDVDGERWDELRESEDARQRARRAEDERDAGKDNRQQQTQQRAEAA